ncbi:hypothetical protein V1503_20660 [Bacillus sp. SCS-151]|uniref:hypothetical protein n=1 Tax=Nanhaiella sioensis TaxID=3115293 RepID=UPI00397B15AD
MSSFTAEELKILQEEYRLSITTKPSLFSVYTEDLLDEQMLHNYLVYIKEKTKSANIMVASSLFVKRYSFAVLIALYAMSALSKKVDFSIKNVAIESEEERDTLWQPFFKLNNVSIEDASDRNRIKWRNDILTQIFANHIDVLFSLINKKCKLSMAIMWENLYIYIKWMYEKLLSDSQYNHLHETITDDYIYLLQEGPSSLFGSHDHNPFSKFAKSKHNNQSTYKRTSCCFSYLVGDQRNFCKICPIVHDRKKA